MKPDGTEQRKKWVKGLSKEVTPFLDYFVDPYFDYLFTITSSVVLYIIFYMAEKNTV